MQIPKKIFSITFVIFAILPFTASADSTPVPIHLTVVTNDTTLFDADISVRECFDTESGTTTSVNALCAIQQAASTSGWTTDLVWYSFGPFLNGINSYQSDFVAGRSWSYFTDGASGLTSISSHTLHSGEKLLFTYAISPLRVILASSSPRVGTTTMFQAQYFDSTNTFDWANATETVFVVDGVPMVSDAGGALRYTPVSDTSVIVTVQKAGFVESNAVVLTPYLVPSVPIHLRIETNTETLYNADINVETCADVEAGSSTSINALCAVEQAAAEKGLPLGLVWYSFGPFIDSIGSYASDNTNFIYWSYYIDRVDASVGVSAHHLVPGEELLFTYNIAPLRIVSPTQTPTVGVPLVLSGQYFDSMNYVWASATPGTFTVNGAATSSDKNGQLTIIPTDTSSITVTLSRAGFIESPSLTLTPITQNTQASSGGSATPEATHTIDITKAVGFLRGVESADGSFGAPLYTDWVAIGLSGIPGADDIRAKLVTYMKASTDPGSLLTDLERRAMALESLGMDPSTGTSRDYIKEMFTHWDGSQWGDTTLINDDIFALIPILHAGYGASDEVVTKTVATLVAAQSASGSWGSIDLTAACIEALTPVSSLPGTSEAIAKARVYLQSRQEQDGGFGSSFATSWVLQSIAGENLAQSWMKNGKTPQDYLWLLQSADGGIESTVFDQSSRVWATSYAIPAASGKDWNALLGSYPRQGGSIPAAVFGSAPASLGEVLGTTTLATTTLAATSSSATSTEVSTISLVNFTVSSSSTSTLASSTPTKKEIRQVKKPVVKKVSTTSLSEVAPAVVASTTVSSTTQMTPQKTSWTTVITRPFVRLFKAFSSWFD